MSLIDTLAGAVVGGLIGVVGGYWSAVRLQRKTMLENAGERLWEAFKPEALALHNLNWERSEEDPFGILRSAWEKHLAAVIEFRRFLDRENREGFNAAWKTYYGYEKKGYDQPFLEQYSRAGISRSEALARRDLALNRLEKILQFVVHKPEIK